MKRIFAISTITAAVCAGSAQPQATRDALHKIYDNLSESYTKGDVDAIMKWTTTDYKWTLLDGKILNEAEAKSSIKDQLKAIQSGTWKIKIVNVVAAGPLANVVAEYKFDGVLLDPGKKVYKAVLTSTERQNWVQTPNGWRQTSDQVLNQSTSTGTTNKEQQNVNGSKTSGGQTAPTPVNSGGGGGSGHQA